MIIRNHDIAIFHLPDIWRTDEDRASDPNANSVYGRKSRENFHQGPSIRPGQAIEVPDWYVEHLRARYKGWAKRMTPEGIIRRPLRGAPAHLRSRIEQRRALRARHGAGARVRS